MQDILERVTTKEAARELGVDVETLQYLMRKERLPIGFAQKKDGKKRYHYIIWRTALDKYKESIGT
jgi:orotate phosphoribosyltransferase-like protein